MADVATPALPIHDVFSPEETAALQAAVGEASAAKGGPPPILLTKRSPGGGIVLVPLRTMREAQAAGDELWLTLTLTLIQIQMGGTSSGGRALADGARPL